jgi:hypothetical protein
VSMSSWNSYEVTRLEREWRDLRNTVDGQVIGTGAGGFLQPRARKGFLARLSALLTARQHSPASPRIPQVPSAAALCGGARRDTESCCL